MMGHTKDGWVDITNIPSENVRVQEFDQIVYTEKLTREEIKDMYPELYEQYFNPDKGTQQELEKSIDAALEIGNPEVEEVRKEAIKSIIPQPEA